ncbi:MAG: hypothetical protein HY548_03460 [Elusimicrobia bacterium]|nr:hypothetical protein [Elusimicrobiota bacterium]
MRAVRTRRTYYCFALASFMSMAAPSAWAARITSLSPSELMEQALEAFLEERFEDAATYFQKALEMDPRNETAKQGIKSAERQLKLKVERERAQERPALKSAQEAIRRGDWVDAHDRLRSVLRRVPNHPDASKLSESVRKRAEALHEKARPNTSDWFFSKGVLAYLDGDWYKAAQVWEQVYAFDPDKIFLVAKIDKAKRRLEEQQREERIGFYKTLGWENIKKRDFEGSIQAWQELLKILPNNAEALEGLRQAQDGAIRDSERRRAEDVQNLTEKAMNAYVEQEYAESVKLWKKVQELDPGSTLPGEYLQRIQLRGRGSSGYSYGSSYSSGSSSPSSGYQRALGFAKEEKYNEAIEHLERYISRNPGDNVAKDSLQDIRNKQKVQAEKLYKDGLVAYSQGNVSEAIKVWQSVLRVDPDYQKARQALIKALAENKKQ